MRPTNHRQKLIAAIIVATLAVAVIAAVITIQLDTNQSNTGARDDCIQYRGNELCPDRYIGLSMRDAHRLASDDMLTTKIRTIDDEGQLNHDMGGPAYVHFVIENDTVTKAELSLAR